MNQLIIDIENWKHQDNKAIIKAVRKALQEIANDGWYEKENHYTDYGNTGIELKITIK